MYLTKTDALIRAASRRVNDLFPDGKKLSQARHMTSMKADIAALLDAGIAEGLVGCGEALWLDKRGPDRHWRLTYVPVRDEANSWYLHTMLPEISARDY